MNTRYQIKGFLKRAENVCDPESYTTCYVELTFVGDTAEQAIQECAKFLRIEPNAITRNACDEDGRVDFARTETTILLQVKKNCVYSGVVEKVQTVRI